MPSAEHLLRVLRGSLSPGGEVDYSSLHGSCPTTAGEKWSATKWIHVGPFGGTSELQRAKWCVLPPRNPIGQVVAPQMESTGSSIELPARQVVCGVISEHADPFRQHLYRFA